MLSLFGPSLLIQIKSRPMYTTRLVPSDFRMTWFEEDQDVGVEGDKTKMMEEEPSARIGNQPPLGFYSAVRPGPLGLNARAATIRSIFGKDSDELALEMGQRLDLLAEQATCGYSWMVPLGLSQTAKSYLEERRAKSGLSNGVDDALAGDGGDNQNIDHTEGNITDSLVENAYTHPPTVAAGINGTDVEGVTGFSGNSIDESSAFEVGDIGIEHTEEGESLGQSAHYEEPVEQDLDADMSYRGILDFHADMSADSEAGDYVPGRYLPENIHSSFHVSGHREEEQANQQGDDDEQYFMAREDYQDDHSILEPRTKMPPPSRVVSDSLPRDIGRTGASFLQSSVITTASTLQSATAGPNQLTGETSFYNNSSDSDMAIE